MIGPELLRELSDAGRAMLSGAMITLVYDLLRIFRRIVRHGRLWVDLEDALFWGWTSLWIFGVLYRIHDGAFRIYTIVMMFLGMLGYHRYIGELLVAVVSGGLKRVLKILGMPLKKFKTYLIIFENKLKKLLKRSIMKFRRVRQQTNLEGMSDDKSEKKKAT